MNINHALHGDPICFLELYSGIGGMSCALKDLPVKTSKVIAIDINPNARKVYSLNFPSAQTFSQNINSLTSEKFNFINSDLLTMSPPCQPFTRNGLKKDINDPRTDSFIHLMSHLWPNIQKKPQFLLVENVKGFESSIARDILISSIKNDYETQEFILSPSQYGVPNSRLRYYLIAKKLNSKDNKSRFCFLRKDEPLYSLPNFNTKICPECKSLLGDIPNQSTPKVLREFLSLESDNFDKYKVPLHALKYFQGMDIVGYESNHSCCFTRSYSSLVTSTGSILSCNLSFDEKNMKEKIDPEKMKLRYFTPREVATLMSFPPSFKFPEEFSDSILYKLLGNSLNIKIVNLLFRLLFAEPVES